MIPPRQLLNIGCGEQYHPAWINVDLVARGPEVIRHDLRRGLPFDNGTIDAVYHSHVLEHLDPERGRDLIAECYRVIKPGGVVRVIIPDLEAIARNYLDALERADRSKCGETDDYDWMMLELLDQLIRTRSGGRMAAYTNRSGLPNMSFVASRLGDELNHISDARHARRQMIRELPTRRAIRSRMRRLVDNIRESCMRCTSFLVYGNKGYAAWKEGMFRQSGEIHRWMYDRFSLGRLLSEAGFIDVVVRRADESRIEGFAEYDLDAVEGRVRKPDSLFMEATKPRSNGYEVDVDRAA
jgi:SAM-dependent methyltransferase